MGNNFFNEYPYTDFHELNLSWVIRELRSFATTLDQFVSINALKYADPIQWDITRQYEKNTIVIDPVTGTAYISVKAVPMGAGLSDTNYWCVVFDLGRFITLASQNFALSYEAVLTTTATMPTSQGDWVVWNSILYEALNDIHIGDAYIVDGNIRKTTVEEFYRRLANRLEQEITDRTNADTTLQNNINAEATLRANADTALQNNIDAEATLRANADTALQNNIDAEATLRANADNTINTRIDGVNTALSNETTARINADNALSDRISKVLDKKYIILGDSYGGQPDMNTSWIAYMKLYMGLTEGTNVFSGKLDGSGFANRRYETLIQSVESLYPSMPKTEITDIVVCGGSNDLGNPQLDVINGMIAFINYCAANYPNATVHIGFIAMRNDAPQYNYNMMTTVMQWYKGASQCGIKANYIVGSEWIWHNYSYIQGDGIHPTAFASEYLGRGLASYFETGSVLIADTAVYSATLNPSGYSTSVTGSLTEYYNGSHVDIYLELMAVTNTFSNNIVEIASFTPMHCKGDYNCRVLLPALINGTTLAQCEISIQNGKILAFPIGSRPNTCCLYAACHACMIQSTEHITLGPTKRSCQRTTAPKCFT